MTPKSTRNLKEANTLLAICSRHFPSTMGGIKVSIICTITLEVLAGGQVGGWLPVYVVARWLADWLAGWKIV